MRKIFVIHFFILAGILASAGCKHKTPTPGANQQTLRVFAAASLTESFQRIGKDFESSHPGVSVTFNFAGSQQLREQLVQGAPADVFASANTKEMDAAKAAALVNPTSIKIFARNRLIVIFPKSASKPITALADLAKPGLRLDIADPAVPVGKYTAQMLDRMSKDAAFGPDFAARVKANVVSREDNVKSVVAKVRLGEADAGVVYVTDVTPESRRDISTIDIPDAFNQIADYPVAVTSGAAQPELAHQFVDYLLSDEGRQVLHGYGFLSAAATTQP